MKLHHLKVNKNQPKQNSQDGVGKKLQEKVNEIQTRLKQRKTLEYSQRIAQELEGINEKINFIQAMIAEGEKNDLALIKKIQNTYATPAIS